MAQRPYIDHAQRLVLITGQEAISEDEFAIAMDFFRHPDFPVHYDVMNLMQADIPVEVNWHELSQYGLERQRILSQRAPDCQIRYAFVDAPEGLKSLMKTWALFFPNIGQRLLIRYFDTEVEAFDWLKRTPVDTTSLQAFPLPDPASH